MLLGDLLGADAPPVEVTDLAFDDRAVGPGTLFFCVRGFTRDGHDFAPVAVERGAVALVVERPLGLGVPEVVVPSARAAMAPAAARLHGDPTATLRAVGITGTSGKTTTSFLLRSLLEAGGIRTGLMGTVASVVGGEERPAVRTTPEAIDLQRDLRGMLDAGDEAVVMEVSSHALELHRVDAIHWAAAVFTNLSPEHLDFHPDMEAYFAAKRRLFEAGPGVEVVNVDDPWGARLVGDDTITVGLEGGDLRATDLRPDAGGTRFRVGDLELRVPLPGRFNVVNALCAVGVARALGVEDATIAEALPRAARAPGRFEPVDCGQGFAVVVDYAHKPDALAAVLRTARELARGRVLVVFGAGGDRDRAKRPLMGAAAVEGADRVVVTSDNPRNEAPMAIVAEILDGITGRGHADVVLDRRAAIEHAIGLAQDGDVVVIAGKGHETYQELEGGRTIPFDDRIVAREALRARLVA